MRRKPPARGKGLPGCLQMRATCSPASTPATAELPWARHGTRYGMTPPYRVRPRHRPACLPATFRRPSPIGDCSGCAAFRGRRGGARRGRVLRSGRAVRAYACRSAASAAGLTPLACLHRDCAHATSAQRVDGKTALAREGGSRGSGLHCARSFFGESRWGSSMVIAFLRTDRRRFKTAKENGLEASVAEQHAAAQAQREVRSPARPTPGGDPPRAQTRALPQCAEPQGGPNSAPIVACAAAAAREDEAVP